VDPLNPVYSSLDGVMFNKSQRTLMEYPAGRAGAYIVPDGVEAMSHRAFFGCVGLTSVTMRVGFAAMDAEAFYNCLSLEAVSFRGNAPLIGSNLFLSATNVIVYYLPGTTGWGPTFSGRPTSPWVLPYPAILTITPDFGVQDNVFGFRISWATNATVVVEATADISDGSWVPVGTNSLVNGWSDFEDEQWISSRHRFYRIRW